MTYDELVRNGYKIENAKIVSHDLSMEDHGCLTLAMAIEGFGWGFIYGGYCLGKGYLGAHDFSSYEHTAEYIMRIMDTVGVEKFSDLTGKYIRVAIKSEESINIIGNIISDKWFDTKEFMSNT